MNGAIPRRTIAVIVGVMLACMCAIAIAAPDKAHADGLTATSLHAQSSSNLTVATATPISLGSSASCSYDSSDLANDGYVYYWFSYTTSMRNSMYSIRVDSVNGKRITFNLFDENINSLTGNDSVDASRSTKTFYNGISSSNQLGKTRYIRLHTIKYNVKYGDAFKVTVSEHPIIKKATGLKASKKAKKSITMKWGKQANATKYQVKWKKKGSGWKTVTTTSTSKKFTKLKKNTKYQFKVRAYCQNGYNADAGTVGNWGNWSVVKTVKTKK